MACQDDQLCARLKAGIDGVIHGFKLFGTKTQLWKIGVKCCQSDTYGGPELVLSLIAISSLVVLVLRNRNGTTSFLHS